MQVKFCSTQTIVLSGLIIIVCGCSTDSTEKTSIDTDPSLNERLQLIVDDAVDSGLPGVSLHVQHRDETISHVAGVVNRDTDEPVTPSSLFHAASIGKTFVAAMLLRLIDTGFLQFSDPIDRWLSSSMSSQLVASDRITVEMLLAHTSGIPDYFNTTEFVEDFLNYPGRSFTPTEILGYVDDLDNDFEPGSAYRYSNTNYLLLGVIAERITGVSLDMALRQWVIEPAGLENTFGSFENQGQTETAHGYVPASFIVESGLDLGLPANGTELDTTAWLLSEGHGDAPIHSTPADLNAFIRTLIDTDTLVSADLKTRMLTESFPGMSEHGLGIFIAENGLTYYHDGGAFGLISMMSYTPSENWSFATMVNGSFGEYEDIFRAYLTKIYSTLGGE